MIDKDNGQQKDKQQLTIDEIREMETAAERVWSVIHSEYRENLKFSYGYGDDQWNPKALEIRNRQGRPSETYNIISSFVRPFINIIKENPPAITVYPIADGANKTQAKLVAGIIRAIEYNSNAQKIYTQALENATRGGIGAWRIIPKLVFDGVDDDVDIVTEAINDPTNLLIDPGAMKSDFSDAEWYILKTVISKAQYVKDYPEGRAQAINDQVELRELWYKVIETTLGLNPETLRPEPRKSITIYQYIYDEFEVLSCIKTIGSKLNFCIVTGEQFCIDGITKYGCITKELMAPQREINWLKSEAIAAVACSPKAMFIADSDAFTTMEERDAWERSHLDPTVVLTKKKGTSITEITPPTPPTGYMALADKNIDIARLITGIYPDPTTQNGLNPVSGKAINAQQAGQGVATYHYVDSLKYAIKRSGEIILDILPHFYNDNKVRLSMNVDGSYSPVSLGDQEIEGADNFDLAYGRYGVSISTGPTYASQKDALINTMTDLMKTNPQAMGLSMDWLIKNLNLPGSEELSDRFKLTLPHPIQELIAQQEGQSNNPEEQLRATFLKLQNQNQELQKAKQTIDQLTDALEHETSQLQSKQTELQIKQQIESEKNETTIRMKEMELKLKLLETQLKAKQHEDDQYDKHSEKELSHKHKMEQMALKNEMDTEKEVTKSLVSHAIKINDGKTQTNNNI